MSITRKLTLAAFLTALLLAAGANTAIARTVVLAPSGNITALSLEAITFTSNEGSISCHVRLAGTVVREASGTLGVLDPARNARIGQVTSGSTERCSLFSAARMLFGPTLWSLYKISKERERTRGYLLNVQFLISAFGVIACLYDALVEVEYNETTGRMRIIEMRVLTQEELLSGGDCPTRALLVGEFLVDPRIRVTLRDR